QAFQEVTADSPDYARALTRAGDSYWKGYTHGVLKPAQERDPEKLAAWLKAAQESLANGLAEQLKARKGETLVPRELAEAQLNLAEVSLECGQAGEAVRLVGELVPKISAQKELEPIQLRALIALLRGHVVRNDLEAA